MEERRIYPDFIVILRQKYRVIEMLIIKVVHSAPMIVANFIDRYLPGILAVSMNRLFYLVPFGRITGAYSSYSSSQRPDLPSLPTPILEPFPSFSQSLTLSNRLSINMPAGSSPSTSLSVAIGFSGLTKNKEVLLYFL
jgi:hypothetical protein